MVLAYRPEGASDFLARDMEPESGTEYVARIPEPATRGGSVAYYIEARGRGGQALARNGSPDEPHVITLAGATAPGGRGPGRQRRAPGRGLGRPGAAAVASGWRWASARGGGYAKGSPEVNPNYLDADTAGAGRCRSAAWRPPSCCTSSPEIGYFVTPKMMLSVQGRLQYTTGATEVHHASCGATGICKPATGAVAVLGRATWFLGKRAQAAALRLAAGRRRVHPLPGRPQRVRPSDGLRSRRGTRPAPTPSPAVACWSGPARGLPLRPDPRACSSPAGLNALLGLPKTAFNFDLNLGLGYRL